MLSKKEQVDLARRFVDVRRDAFDVALALLLAEPGGIRETSILEYVLDWVPKRVAEALDFAEALGMAYSTLETRGVIYRASPKFKRDKFRKIAQAIAIDNDFPNTKIPETLHEFIEKCSYETLKETPILLELVFQNFDEVEIALKALVSDDAR